jgi:hypothetical protein
MRALSLSNGHTPRVLVSCLAAPRPHVTTPGDCPGRWLPALSSMLPADKVQAQTLLGQMRIEENTRK